MGNSAEEQVDAGASGGVGEARVTASPAPVPAAPVLGALPPIMAAVFIVYLVIGLALPVLPLHVHHGLGLGTFVVGLVAGAQYAATLVSRLWSGHYADDGVGCEACHGPGARHAETKARVDVVHPVKRSPEEALAVCGQCHDDG